MVYLPTFGLGKYTIHGWILYRIPCPLQGVINKSSWNKKTTPKNPTSKRGLQTSMLIHIPDMSWWIWPLEFFKVSDLGVKWTAEG